ncbi:MAG TPA: hypothetical protein VFZ52_01210 [Chryseolinea sp.]
MNNSFGPITSGVVIHQFSASNNLVKKGEPFSLNWNVDGADKIELYRNGALFQTLGGMQTSIDRTEFYDSQKEVRYDLVAYRQGTLVRSSPVIIKFGTPRATAAPVTNTDTTKLLLQSAMWAKFIGICGIVLLSLFVLVALILAVTDARDAQPTALLAASMVVIFLGPVITLLSFASNTNRSTLSGNDLVASFRNLKLFFQVVGITLIVLMLTTIILYFNSNS